LSPKSSPKRSSPILGRVLIPVSSQASGTPVTGAERERGSSGKHRWRARPRDSLWKLAERIEPGRGIGGSLGVGRPVCGAAPGISNQTHHHGNGRRRRETSSPGHARLPGG
jgi:hypothetical protein